ncbi:helix-turn-helix domain-containing protein [Sphingomonas faeni]|uniref:helix-turn-helix domain-containing protein n=1 Tax=Sphingomonas faeni TaxID=185950 RepID=UPI0020C7FE64|nr:helix-turn-helix transcriptional regulator [Sphingomonas faeni]MCP8892822.1 helix-turn-helix transcriptional regulator [Sphingomonas faeni]
MNARDILAQNLRALRRTKGWSQEELADRAQIDRTYVSALERCIYAASVDVLDRLANALGVTVATLFDEGTSATSKE